jgi:hypothetical protein
MSIHYFQLGQLKREYHHIARSDSEPVTYEPAMVILNERKKGRSFVIPADSIWKYVEPKDNEDAMAADAEDFNAMLRAIDERRMNLRARMRLTPKSNAIEWDKIMREKWEIEVAIKAVPLAIIAPRAGMMRCMMFNLCVALQIFEIPVNEQTCAQLLLFIQDGLDELKNMPPYIEPPGQIAGEVDLYEGTTKIGSAPVRITDTELLTEHSETEGEA